MTRPGSAHPARKGAGGSSGGGVAGGRRPESAHPRLEGKHARAAPPGYAAAMRALEEKCQGLKARVAGLEERLLSSEEGRRLAERALEGDTTALPPPPCEVCPGNAERIKRLEMAVAGVESEKRKVLEKVKAQHVDHARLKKIIEEEKKLLQKARQEARALKEREYEGEQKLSDAVRRVREETARGLKSKEAELEKAKKSAAARLEQQAELKAQNKVLDAQVVELQRELQQTQVAAAQAGVRHERELEVLRAETAARANRAGKQELSVEYLSQKLELVSGSLQKSSVECARLKQNLRQSEVSLNNQQLKFARKLCDIEEATKALEDKQRVHEENGARRLMAAKSDVAQLLLQLGLGPNGTAPAGTKKAPAKFRRSVGKMGVEELLKQNRELAELNSELLFRANEWQHAKNDSRTAAAAPQGSLEKLSRAREAHDIVVAAGKTLLSSPGKDDAGAGDFPEGSPLPLPPTSSASSEVSEVQGPGRAAESAVEEAADDLIGRIVSSAGRAELADLKVRHEEQSRQLQQARDELEAQTEHGQALFLELSEMKKSTLKDQEEHAKMRKSWVAPENVQDLHRKIHDLEAAAKQHREVVQRKTLSYESARSDNERKDATLKEQAASIDELTSEVLTLRDDLKRKEASLETYKTRLSEFKENIATHGQEVEGTGRAGATLGSAKERPSTAPTHGKRSRRTDERDAETLKDALQEIENLQISLEKSRHQGKNRVLLADARVRQLNQQLEWTREEYIQEIENLQRDREALHDAVGAYEKKLGTVAAASAKSSHELGRTQSRNARLERDLEKTTMQLNYFKASYTDRLREKEKEARDLASEAARKGKIKSRLQDCTAFVISCP